jgi:bifunctional non-homologous end joining protein LigD
MNQSTHTTKVSKKKGVIKKARTLKRTAPNKISKKVKLISEDITEILNKAPKVKFPSKLIPMYATLVNEPANESGWLYEVKWDGYRALAFSNKGTVELRSRNEKSFTDKFYPITADVKEWNINAIVDGEIVVLQNNGISSFGSLQNWRSEADGELMFYVFDILWYEGKDLTGLSLLDRRMILKSLFPVKGNIRLSEIFDGEGKDFFETAKQMGLEGIIAKKAESRYYPGNRTKEWLKIKANQRQEMVIGGFTKNEDSRKLFSALLLGVYENGKLIYTGKVGTGFNDKTQREMMEQFKPLIADNPAFTILPDINKPSRFRPDPPHATAVWLKPKLVCEVSFTELSSDGIMRHPSFEGMRMDKKAKDVVMEMPKPIDRLSQKEATFKRKKIIVPSGNKERKTL